MKPLLISILSTAISISAVIAANPEPAQPQINDSLRPLSLSGLISPSSTRLDTSTSYILLDSTVGDSRRIFSEEISLTVPFSETLAAHVAASYSIANATQLGSDDFWNEPRAGISWFPKVGDSFGVGLDLTVGFPSLVSPPAYLDDGAKTSTSLELSVFWDFSPTIAFISAGASGRFGGTGEKWAPVAEAGMMFLLTPGLTAIASLEWGLQSSSVPTSYSVVGVHSDVASLRLGVVCSISNRISGTLDARIGITKAAPDLGVSLGISYGF